MKTLVLEISGMTCNHCADSISRKLATVAGVTDAKADVLAGTVYVNIDETLCAPPQLVEAVRQAGYQVNGYRSAD